MIPTRCPSIWSSVGQAGRVWPAGSYTVTCTNTPKQHAAIARYSGMERQLRVLIIVENLPVPFDRRVWSEATTLRDGGHSVFVICPKGPGYQRSHEIIDGVSIYRHPLPLEARGAGAYFIEYPAALFWEFLLSLKVWSRHGF